MWRNNKIILGFIFSAFPGVVFSLGLGDIELKSVLNQPFDASIELIDAESIDVGEISVLLADQAAFNSADIERTSFLTGLRFSVEKDASLVPYVDISSSESVKEPFLDFVIELNWPNGRLFREYTVLIDPPVMVADTVPSINQVETEVVPLAVQPEAVEGAVEGSVAVGLDPVDINKGAKEQGLDQGDEPKPVALQSMSKVKSIGNSLTYGPVAISETLWSIATKLNKEDVHSVPQVMMALLKDNPQAFDGKNINGLKAGYILKISDVNAISDLSKQVAEQQADQQYKQWMAGRLPIALSDVKADAQANTDNVANIGQMTDGSRLTLVAADEKTQGLGETGSGDLAQDVLSIKNQLAVAVESTAVTQQENVALKNQIGELEQRIADMQRLMTLRDDELAVMQGVDTLENQIALDDMETTASQGEFGPDDLALDDGSEAISAPGTGVINTPAEVTSDVNVAVADESPAPGFFEQLENQLIIGLGVIVALLLGLMIHRRRIAAAGYDEGMLAAESTSQDMGDDALDRADRAIQNLSENDEFDSIHTEVDEMDVLAEADVYIAYKRFDKAEDLLTDALESEPERTELTTKLLECYVASQNVGAFVSKAEALSQTIDTSTNEYWLKIVGLGKQIAPDHELFKDAIDHVLSDNVVDDQVLNEDIAEEYDDTGEFQSSLESVDDELGEDLESGVLEGKDTFVDDAEAVDVVVPDLLEESQSSAGESERSLDMEAEGFDGNSSEVIGSELGDSEINSEDVQVNVEEGKSEEEDDALAFDFDTTDSDDSEQDEKHVESEIEAVAESGNPQEIESLEWSASETVSIDEGLDGSTPDSEDVEPMSGEDMESLDLDQNLDDVLLAGAPEEALESTLDLDELDSSVGAETVEETSDLSGSEILAEDDGLDFDGLIESSDDSTEGSPAGEKELLDASSVLNEDIDNDNGKIDEALLDFDLDSLTLDSDDSTESVLTLEGDEDSTDSSLGADLDWLQENVDLDESASESIASSHSDSEAVDIDDDFLGGDDEVATKLDLAKAYIDMGDKESAGSILDEVSAEGTEEQKTEAAELKNQLG